MLDQRKALLLIGSPKKKDSTSQALGEYILKGLRKNNFTTEKIHAISINNNKEKEFYEKIMEADILIISTPLYVDSLPSSLIKALEIIGENRKAMTPQKDQSLMAIVNSGFPESFQSDIALKICENFAINGGFKWLGGFALGAGGAINGRPLEESGGMTKHIVKALDLATEAIVGNKDIPKEAIELMSKKMMPTWLYTIFGNGLWKSQAKKHGAQKMLYDQPYIESMK